MVHTVISPCTHINRSISAFQEIICHKSATLPVIQTNVGNLALISAGINGNHGPFQQAGNLIAIILMKAQGYDSSTSRSVTMRKMSSISEDA